MPYIGNPAVVGDSTNTFKLLDDIQSFTLTFDATDTSVVSISGDTLTFRNHRFLTGQRVTYTDGGGTAIGGLTDGTVYFIIKVDQNTIQLATNASNAAAGTAIDLTSGAAGGSHTLNVAFDGVNTKFSATHSSGTKAGVSRAGQISLSINGVIQQPQDTGSPTTGYGVLPGSIIIFSTPPASVDKVFGTFIGEVAPSFDLTDNTVDNFTGDGSTTSFNLSRDVPSSNDVLVTLDGVTQYPTDSSATRSYAVIESTLTFVSAPDTGVAIQVRHIGFAGATTSAVTGFYGRQGNVALVNTDDISVQNISAGIATFNTIAVGGTVSIGGTLTYEDVTNIDSVGLVTARNGIVVGSGITLSKDGDVFFTGIATGNGSGLTALNASNISSGTVPTARLGSGTASSSTFLRGDSSFQTVNTDLVSDTTPQLGGNLDVNSKTINLGDSSGETVNRIRLGADNDGDLFHDGTDLFLREVDSGQILLRSDGAKVFANANGSENQAIFRANGNVELYYDNSVKLATLTNGVQITGQEFISEGTILLEKSGAHHHRILSNDTGNDLGFQQSSDTGANTNFTTYLRINDGGNISLPVDSQVLNLGASQDMQLYHNGTDSYILNATGKLRIGQYNNNEIKFFTSNSTRWNIGGSGHIYPDLNNAYDIGTSTYRVRNIYTNDLNLSNKGSTNSVDGTWGNYTIQEGESDLFLINNRSGKKYKFNLTEVS